MVWDYHVQVFLFFLASLFGSSCFDVVKVLASYPGSFDGPCGVLAFSESSKKMFFLFLQQLGVEHTVDAL